MKLFVIGKPIKHSLSPIIHNFWIKKYKINAVYNKKEIEENQLYNVIEKIKTEEILGINITLPYKKKIFHFIDEVSKNALESGAINTVFLRNGKVYGENTDGKGFVRAIKLDLGFSLKKKNIFLIGSGGASLGIISELINHKVNNIHITNRTSEKAINVIKKFKQRHSKIFFTKWEKMAPQNDIDLIINTSSLGMKKEDKFNFDFENLNKNVLFSDIIYNPKETNLLKEFRSRGYRTTNGLGMLVNQAAIAFNLWFDVLLSKSDINKAKEICEQNY
ncbi:MAG: shikimate dehydrogenase [Alphaproteobacteria bacterium]|tara:strand:- start:822 stop:1649 length:828 start_codon:yes stop_codon:yes gene_type:complete